MSDEAQRAPRIASAPPSCLGQAFCRALRPQGPLMANSVWGNSTPGALPRRTPATGSPGSQKGAEPAWEASAAPEDPMQWWITRCAARTPRTRLESITRNCPSALLGLCEEPGLIHFHVLEARARQDGDLRRALGLEQARGPACHRNSRCTRVGRNCGAQQARCPL